MRRTIVPFTSEHIDGAAALLAARHRTDREREPYLPARFEDIAATRGVVQTAFSAAGASGVVALADGRMAGYLISEPSMPAPTSMWALFARPRSMRISYGAHAAGPDDAVETYRELYAAIAPRWIEAGCFSHYVDVAAADEAVNEAWFSLGFGEDIAGAVRDTGPVRGEETAAAIEAHQASAEDIDVVMKLVHGLMRHHATPPIFFPYLPETEADQRRFQLDMINEPTKPNWIGYQEGRPVALQSFVFPNMLGEMISPERSVYLLQGFTEADIRGGGVGTALLARTMAWARETGYDYCALNFMTANLSGARFWLSHGFRPVEYRLMRQIDERIAWAKG